MSHVFISYSHEDREVARRYAQGLQAAGLEVWWDDHLRSGEAFDERIEAALRAAAVVLVLWSKTSVSSRWVRAEATLAERTKTLLPVMIEPCERPIMFELIHTAELAHWRGAADDRAWLALVAEVRRFSESRAAGPATAAAADPIIAEPQARREPLLAVLPFDNLSSDAEMAFFSDGVSEDILGRIMRGSKLKVIGRTSSFQFRGADKPKAAAALNATHVLDGSIRRADDKVRIAAHLTEAESQTTLWTDRYDRGLADIFAVQDEISEAIARALDSAFFPVKSAKIDPAIYDLYLRTKTSTAPGLESLRTEVASLQVVTAAAPDFVEGWSSLVRALGLIRWELPLRDRPAIEAALAIANARCLALDPDNINVLVLGGSLDPFGDYLAWEPELHRMAKLGAASAQAQVILSLSLEGLGRGREALEAARRGRTLDPLSGIASATYAQSLWRTGRFAEGRAALEAQAERQPGNHYVNSVLILACAHQQDWDAVDRLTTPNGLISHPLRELSGVVPIVAGFRDPASEVGRRVFGAVRARALQSGHIDPTVTVYFASMGLVDECFDLLEACRFGPAGDENDIVGASAYATYLLFPAAYPELRADPRFVTVCARLGLVEYWLETGKWPDCADVVPYDFRAECEKARHIPKDRYLRGPDGMSARSRP